MSKRHLIASYPSVAAVLVIAVWATVALFPLTGSAQVVIQQGAVVDSSGVTVQPGGQLLHRTPVRYPAGALQGRIAGVVVVSLSLDADGNVMDARVLSGPQELRRAVLEPVLQWHYLNTSKSPNTVQATIEFRIPETPPAATAPAQPAPAIAPSMGIIGGIISAAPTTPQATESVLAGIDVSSLGETLQSMLREKLTQFIGQPMSSDLMSKIKETVTQVDSHLALATTRIGGAMMLSVRLLENSALLAAPAAPTSQTTFPPTPGVQRIRVGGNVQSAKLVSAPKPTYPPLARQARIQGAVRFDVLIGTDGRMMNVQLASGPPLLVQAAQEVVQQWVYQPTLLNGQPVEVQTTIDVNFAMQ